MSRKAVISGVVTGFVAVGGGFAIAAAVALRTPPVPAFAAVSAEVPAAGPEPEPETMLVYVPIDAQVAVAVPEQPVRVMLRLGVAVRGSPEVLLALKAEVAAAMPSILAAVLRAAQVEVARTADPVLLMQRLPGPLRGAVNGVIGTAELPEPVEEVLIMGLMAQ